MSCYRASLRRYVSTASPRPRRVVQPDLDQIFNGTPDTAARQLIEEASEDDWRQAVELSEGKEEETPRSRHRDDDALQFASNRVGQVVLPRWLNDRVERILEPVHGPGIRANALRFYDALKLKSEGRRPEDVPLTGTSIMPPSKHFTPMEADAYLAALMPQLYATVYVVLLELRKRLGKAWLPADVLDVGMGPGTGAAAFREVFVAQSAEKLEREPELLVVEVNDALRDRAEKIWRGAGARVFNRLGNIGKKHDLLLAAHSLSDLKGHPVQRDVLVRDLQSRLSPGGVLVLIERGTPLGFESIARAREILLRAKDGHVVAPCPHDGTCPMYRQGHQPERRQWCHFSQRLQRPAYLQKTKHAKDNTEDCTYAYLVYRQGPRPVSDTPAITGEVSHEAIVSASYSWPRIVLPPMKRHRHVVLDVCTPEEQIQRATVPRSQGDEQYRFARKAHWGDLLPFRGKTVVEHELYKTKRAPRDRQGPDGTSGPSSKDAMQ